MTTRMVPDDFEFERTLGVGAFSKVLVAKYTPDNKRYAIKIIAKRNITGAATEEERTRLMDVARREMRMLLMCDHPNIIRFHASMQTNEDLMYVTELCEGGELLDAIKKRGSIPIAALRHVAAELLNAISYLHTAPKRSIPIVQGAPLKPKTIIHRDIKPENIMLSATKHVLLIDFGTATLCEKPSEHVEDKLSSGNARAGTFCGTTQYMSPELLLENYTCVASDYWAAGCVIYHALFGKRPFDGATQYLIIKSILEDSVPTPSSGRVDADAMDLLSKILVKDPTKRLGSPESGGFDAIKQHPFFSSIANWDTLNSVDVTPLWQRDVDWANDRDVLVCKQCGKEFGFLRRKHHCRNCGLIFCGDCTTRCCVIPESSYTTQERVCDGCFSKMNQ